jgi:hypothetical protein
MCGEVIAVSAAGWAIAIAPAFVSFAAVVALAIAWSVWLDRQPGAAGDSGQADLRDVASSSGTARTERRSKDVLGALALVALSATAVAAQTTEQAADPPQAPAPADAPETPNPWRTVKFGAAFEGYYEYNWNRPPDRSLALHAYDTRANTFGIQQAALVVDAAPNLDVGRRYGLRVDLQFGQATETVQGGAANEPRPDVYRHVWQAYGTYLFPLGKNGLQADFGKFASILGYETNYAKDNQAFTRAYLFNFLPFYHSGLRLTLPLNDKVSVLYMLTNGVQQTEEFNDFKSNHFAAVVKPTSLVSWTINYYFGQEQSDANQPGGPDGFFRVFDTYVTVTPTPSVALGLDVNYVTSEVQKAAPSLSLQGAAVYARYQISGPVGVGVRYERLDDEGLFGGIAQVLHEATLTAEYKLADGFLVRGEFRRDWSNEAFFPGRLGADDLRGHQSTALIGAVWAIGNKTGTW